MLRPDEVSNWTFFIRHGYWALGAGLAVGWFAGLATALGAWISVHYMQEWKERHNYQIWRDYKKPAQSARAASAGRISA